MVLESRLVTTRSGAPSPLKPVTATQVGAISVALALEKEGPVTSAG